MHRDTLQVIYIIGCPCLATKSLEGQWWPQGGAMGPDRQLIPSQLNGGNSIIIGVHLTMHLVESITSILLVID